LTYVPYRSTVSSDTDSLKEISSTIVSTRVAAIMSVQPDRDMDPEEIEQEEEEEEEEEAQFGMSSAILFDPLSLNSDITLCVHLC
jgi:hypothetical protein